MTERYKGFLQDCRNLVQWADIRADQGLADGARTMAAVLKTVKAAHKKLEFMSPPKALLAAEPNTLAGIRAARPKGPRRYWSAIPMALFRDKLAGAWLGRCAGCTLGAAVEFYSIEDMQHLAKVTGMSFPPREYWKQAMQPFRTRYNLDMTRQYAQSHMKYVPVDDDLTYTLLDLFILEDHGPDFTTRDVGKAWLKYLPMACTAEAAALANLKKGIKAEKAAVVENPWMEWIGGDIRADGWGCAPGWPEKAAELAYRESYISHRFSGIYGTMFVAAAISAAMAVNDTEEALEIALTEIPKASRTAKAVRWALSQKKRVRNWKQAREAVDKKFLPMSLVHTDNNLALSIFGLLIGKKDFTKVISETVAMGMDNDCTAATSASIFGAAYGLKAIPGKWVKPFNNRIRTYMKGREWLTLADTLKRFEHGAKRVFAGK